MQEIESYKTKKNQIAKSIVVQFVLNMGIFALISVAMMMYIFIFEINAGAGFFLFIFSITIIPILFGYTSVVIALIGLYRFIKAYEQFYAAKKATLFIEETAKDEYM